MFGCTREAVLFTYNMLSLFRLPPLTVSFLQFEEKIQRLRSLGYVFRRDIDSLPTSHEQKRTPVRRKIYKNWEDSRMKLKEYMATHNGSWDVSSKENPTLRGFVVDQQLQLTKLREGSTSSMTEEKYQRLLDIGVDFPVHTWADRIAQLKEFKKENNHCRIPPTHKVLGKWVTSIRRQGQLLVEGKSVTDLTTERIAELHSIGFDLPSEAKKRDRMENWNTEFETMTEKLRAFKEEHGSCKIMRSHVGHTELFNWVIRIRIEYRKLAKGDVNCRLSAPQLSRLTDIGFVFRQKAPPLTWEARVEHLREYKMEHGSISDVPISHEKLGEFVRRQRKEYRDWYEGIHSAMVRETCARACAHLVLRMIG